MSAKSVKLRGVGLHSGAACSLTLHRADGAVCFAAAGGLATREDLSVVRADRGVCVSAAAVALEVDLVEHLFAALGGLGVQHGIVIEVEGPELPLLDGSALALARAVQSLSPPLSPPSLYVARPGVIELGESRYDFKTAAAAGITVDVEFAPLPPESAHWDGTPDAFVGSIAAARTFGFRREYASLRAAGRAAHVDPASVLVLEEDGSVAPGSPPLVPRELARHKLLDLVGDLYLWGGPPRGLVHAVRPGHARTHQAVRRALGEGLLART